MELGLDAAGIYQAYSTLLVKCFLETTLSDITVTVGATHQSDFLRDLSGRVTNSADCGGTFTDQGTT